MKICIFTTYNYQDGEALIKAQAEKISEFIKDTNIEFVPLRYNLPNKYITFQQAIDYGMSHLINDYDCIFFFPVSVAPKSKESFDEVIEKCRYGFAVVDGEAFAVNKNSYSKLKEKETVDVSFTVSVQLKEKKIDPEMINPFGCFVLKHKIPNGVFESIVDEVNRVRVELKNDKFVNQNNFDNYLAGKNSYQIKMNSDYMKLKGIDEYLLSLGRHYIEHTKTPFPNIKMGSTWINYGYKGDYNPIHTHDSLLSGAIYVHQDEGIMKEMEEGSQSGRDTSSIPGMTHFVHDLNYHPFNKFSYSNPFVKGEVVMFPSWLSHWVNPFRTAGERVTVAFNILEE